MRARATTIRLLLAMAGSLAIHALVMSSARIELAAPPQPRPPLEARLAPAPEAPAAPKAAPKRRPETQQAAAKPPTLPVPVISSSIPLYVPPEWDLDPVPEPEVAPLAAAEQPRAERLALAPQSAPEVPVNPLPRNGQIEYSVLYGSGDGLPVGRVVQSWKMENDRYLLASDAETTGIVDFFRPQQLRYISQGRVTSKGLKPEEFFITRTRRGKTEAARAKFDWELQQIHYGYPHDRKVAGLVEGAQDLMSLAYHFALAPPQPGRYRIAVTTGKDFDVQEIEVLPEEIIETPIGQLRTLPVKQIVRPGKEHFDLWLAVQYNYLPVRLRHYDRKGEYSGEQVAVEIRVGDDVELARQ